MLSDQLIRTHIYAAHIGSGISSRRVSPIEEIPHLGPENIIISDVDAVDFDGGKQQQEGEQHIYSQYDEYGEIGQFPAFIFSKFFFMGPPISSSVH